MDELTTIVTRAQEGDLHAFDELVRRFQDMAVGYAFSLLRDLQTAQDVAPEAFLGAHRSLRPLDHPEAFASWLLPLCSENLDNQLDRSPACELY